MPFTIIGGTGFEMGAIPLPAANIGSATTLNSTGAYVKTGAYSVKLEENFYSRGYIQFAVSGTYLDVAAWIRPSGNAYGVRLLLGDGKYVEVRRDATYWKAYVDEVLVEAGTISTENNVFQHVQVRFHVDNAGYIQTKIDGVADIDYSGDTLPASDTISYLEFRASSSDWLFVDDIVYGTGGWPGDIRYDRLMPDADDSVQWTPSAGADNYALVDEIPPSDSDYVSTGSPNYKDKYTLGNWSGTNKTPLFLVAWARAWKDNADTRSLAIGIDSGGTEDSSGSQSLATSVAYYDHIVATDPSTGSPWTGGGIDGSKVFIENF